MRNYAYYRYYIRGKSNLAILNACLLMLGAISITIKLIDHIINLLIRSHELTVKTSKKVLKRQEQIVLSEHARREKKFRDRWYDTGR